MLCLREAVAAAGQDNKDKTWRPQWLTRVVSTKISSGKRILLRRPSPNHDDGVVPEGGGDSSSREIVQLDIARGGRLVGRLMVKVRVGRKDKGLAGMLGNTVPRPPANLTVMMEEEV